MSGLVARSHCVLGDDGCEVRITFKFICDDGALNRAGRGGRCLEEPVGWILVSMAARMGLQIVSERSWVDGWSKCFVLS